MDETKVQEGGEAGADERTDADLATPAPSAGQGPGKTPQTGDEEIPELTLHEASGEIPRPRVVVTARDQYETTAEVPPTRPGLPIDEVLEASGASSPTPPAEPEPIEIRPGGRLGRYQLMEQIGEGGMATIFKARDTHGGRVVALKVLHAHQARSLAGRRFQREYRAIHRVVHPHIVQVFDYAVEQGQPYMAMEFVDGHDLKAHLKLLRTLPAETRFRQVEDLLGQICEALEYIHARGLIHRDLKPSNILLTKEGQAKLTDFGVAKPLDASMQLTQAGMLVGTLAYLAPEVFEQKKLDHRVDLYALGVMLYVMLTDKLPFSGKDITQIMLKHLKHEPESPRRINPAVPDHLDRITMRLLAKDPAARYQSAGEVLRALEIHREEDEAELEKGDPEQGWVPKLVGRTEALAGIREAVAQLSKGRGGVVVVDGAEGVGRSRVVEAGLRLARAQGLGVYTGRCLAGAQGWGEGFRDVVQAVQAEVGRTGQAPDGLERLIASYGVQDLPAPAESEPSTSRGIEADLLALFRGLCALSPRVVWIDDLDQGDPGTWAAVGVLGRSLVQNGDPLLLVATTRGASTGGSTELSRLLSGEATGGAPRLIGLGPLNRKEVSELCESMFQGDPRASALALRLHLEGGGNPMIVTELLRLLMSRGRIGRRLVDGERRWAMAMSLEEIKTLRLPRGLPGILLARLAIYPGQTRTLLRLIAVWGREIRFNTLLRLASASEEAVTAHLDRLLADGWLVENWLGGEDRYLLAHPAYRAVLLSELSPTDHSRLRGFIDLRLGQKKANP